MRALTLALALYMASALVLGQDGPGRPFANQLLRVDANGYLLVANGQYTGPDGPQRNGANQLLRVDANGYLLTAFANGLQVDDYVRLRTVNTAAPAGADCDAAAETGRLHWDSTNDAFRLCSGLSGWVVASPAGGAAPVGAGYWIDTGNSVLTAERNLGALTTGLVLNTVTAGVGVPSAYGGVTCTNQFLRILNASGAGTCASVALAADVSGNLPVGNLNSGTGATANTFWQGNAVWSAVDIASADVTGVLPYANGGTNASTAWTAGSVMFAGASALAQDNDNLFWDNTNKRFGIGTAAPAEALHAKTTGTTHDIIRLDTSSTAAISSLRLWSNGVAAAEFNMWGSTGTRANAMEVINLTTAGTVELWTNATRRVTVDSAGLVGMGIAAPVNRLHIVSSATNLAGLLVTGGTSVGTAATGAGQVLFGHNATVQGRISYDFEPGSFYIDNTYDNALSNIHFRSRTSGVAVNTLSLLGTGVAGIGTTAGPTTGSSVIIFGDGTAPTGMGTNTAGLYVDDFSGTVSPVAIDEASAIQRLVLPQTIAFTATLQANLGAPANGNLAYCSDCTIANPCAGGGTGAFAKRLNGVWVCN